MENSEKRLVELMDEIGYIYVQSKNEQSLQKKLENYQNGMLLIDEAKKKLDDLQGEIVSLNMINGDKTLMANMKKLEELLSPNLNFKEVMYIVAELKKIANGLPTTANINNNTQNEVVIYEEENVNNIETL